MIDALRAALAAVIALACACSGGPRADAARLQTEVAPYLTDVAAFDRWARRLSLADSAFRSHEALEEAAFAPLRGDERVAAAWIVREGPDARALAHPSSAPAQPEDGWVRIRSEGLGALDVRRATLRLGREERACLLVRRSAPAPGGATLHVTMAFAPR